MLHSTYERDRLFDAGGRRVLEMLLREVWSLVIHAHKKKKLKEPHKEECTHAPRIHHLHKRCEWRWSLAGRSIYKRARLKMTETDFSTDSSGNDAVTVRNKIT